MKPFPAPDGSMFTQCSACATVFLIRSDELPPVGERVRCCMCLASFDPRRRLAEELPPAIAAHAEPDLLQGIRGVEAALPDQGHGQEQGQEREQADEDHRGDRADPPGEPVPAAATSAATRGPTDRRSIDWTSGPVSVVPGRSVRRQPAGSARSDAAPEAAYSALGEAELAAAEGDLADWHLSSVMELERAATTPLPGVPGGWRWMLGIAVLSALFLFQVAVDQRNAMAASEQWRPWAEALCAVTGCELPLRRDLDSLRLLRGQVTEHPRVDGALVAAAVVVNEAEFRQSYPLIRLALLAGNQRVAAERWFHPAEYLDDPALRARWQEGLAPGRSIAVRLELQDPGGGAQQYIFEYR